MKLFSIGLGIIAFVLLNVSFPCCLTLSSLSPASALNEFTPQGTKDNLTNFHQ